MRAHHHHPSPVRFALALAVIAAAVLASCSSDEPAESQPAASDSATARTESIGTTPATPADSVDASDAADSADDTITLRVGTDDEPGVPGADQIELFAAEVEARSGGTLVIEPMFSALGDVAADDFDQAVARLAIDGELEMAMVPARAWDKLGVDSLRALHAPFLVTSDDVLRAVVVDPLAEEMLTALETVGVTGLALMPEGLRHVFSFGEPFLTVADFNGVTVRAPTSATTLAAFEALGASVDDFAGPTESFDGGVADGTIAAAESSYLLAGGLPAVSVTAGNITLFPKVNSLVINTDVFESLSSAQRAVLREAAAAAQATTIADLPSELDAAAEFCAFGGEVVLATDAELAVLIREVQSVYSDLEADPETARAIERIREISATIPPGPAVEACAPGNDGPSDVVPVHEPVAGGVEIELVVNTQIGQLSPVVSATGPLESCTEVEDLDGEITELSPEVSLFSGDKVIRCEGGDVTIHYDVTMNVNRPGVTSGTWHIVTSSLAGAGRGNGQLAGDDATCGLLAESDLCVLDTFTGAVAP